MEKAGRSSRGLIDLRRGAAGRRRRLAPLGVLSTSADSRGLAEPGAAGAAPSADRRLHVTFSLAGDLCAVPVGRVREILQCSPITRVPGMPPWLLGVMNVRGQVLPVVDLAPRLDLPATKVTQRSCVLVVETTWGAEPSPFALLVEAVSRVEAFGSDAIEPPTAFGTRFRPELLAGLGRLPEQFAMILDLDSVLASEHLLPQARARDQRGEAGSLGARSSPGRSA